MSKQYLSSPTHSGAALTFPGILGWGAMLAAMLVIAYAGLLSPEAAVRVRMILQGAEVILITLAAGTLAGVLHSLALAGEARHKTARVPVRQQTLTA